MKKSYKNIAILIVLVIGIVLLIGCGKKNNVSPIEEKELDVDIEKAVYDFYGTYDMVYYHKGDTITGLEHWLTYETEADAEQAVQYLNDTKQADDNIEKVEKVGNKVVVSFGEEEYLNTTFTSVKDEYGMLEKTNNTAIE